MVVIVNQSATGAAEWEERIAPHFATAGLKPRFLVAKSGRELDQLARNAAKEPDEIVVAAGGDGTVAAVAAQVKAAGKTLGVLPLGTLNHFARDLHIPFGIEEAVQILRKRQTITVDTGEVNGHTFINNSSIGLYVEMIRRRNKQQEAFNRGKWAAFVSATSAVIRRCRVMEVQVESERQKLHRQTPFVFVGNNLYDLDGFGVTSRPSLTHGKLCLWIGRRTTSWGLLKLAARALFGRLRTSRDFDDFCCHTFTVTPRQTPIDVSLDGEAITLDGPLHYVSRPASLEVLAPQPS